MQEFDIATLKPKSNICIIGAEQSGKSTLAKRIVDDHGIDFTVYHNKQTDIYNRPSQIFDEHIYDTYFENYKNGAKEPFCIIVDDTITDPCVFTSSKLREMHMNGRFINLGIISVMKKPIYIDRLIGYNGNIDKIFIFKVDAEYLYDIYKTYFQKNDDTVDDYVNFVNTFHKITSEPYTCMVVDMCCHDGYSILKYKL